MILKFSLFTIIYSMKLNYYFQDKKNKMLAVTCRTPELILSSTSTPLKSKMPKEKETKQSSFIQTKMMKKNISNSSISTPLLKLPHSRNSTRHLSEIGLRTQSNPFHKDELFVLLKTKQFQFNFQKPSGYISAESLKQNKKQTPCYKRLYKNGKYVRRLNQQYNTYRNECQKRYLKKRFLNIDQVHMGKLKGLRLSKQ